MEKVILEDGITIGETTYKTAQLTTLLAGGVIDAAEAAEKVVLTKDGEAVVITSPALTSAERLRRQIKMLISDDGKELAGPIALSELRRFSNSDYTLLIYEVDKLDAIYFMRENDAGGRSDSTDTSGHAGNGGAA